MKHEVLVGTDGTVRFIYSDRLAAVLAPLGPAVTRRASNVEPEGTGWTADMGPVAHGVTLVARDGQPFPTRAAALEAEVDWLLRHNIPVPA